MAEAWKPLPFEEATAYFESRVPMTRDQADAAGAEASRRAFVVGGIAKADLVADVYTALHRAVSEGTSFADFKRDIRHVVKQSGWEGDTAWRVQTIFRTNIQTAYGAGAWQKLQESKAATPFIQYDAVDDGNTRPEHEAMNGRVYPADDPIWNTWWPPNGFNCRCKPRRLTASMVKARGIRVESGSSVQVLPDPGFDNNPGQDFFGGLVGRNPSATSAYAPIESLSGPSKYDLPALDGLPADRLAPAPGGRRAASKAAAAAASRKALGFTGDATSVIATDPLGDAIVVPRHLADKDLMKPHLAHVLDDAQEVWLVPCVDPTGQQIRMRKHVVTAWKDGTSAAAEIERGVMRDVKFGPSGDPAIESKRVGTLVWQRPKP
jgi:SPP1 gp7 family putative phage head morphogenesis protein